MYKEKGEVVLEEEHAEMLEQIQKQVKQNEIIPTIFNYSKCRRQLYRGFLKT